MCTYLIQLMIMEIAVDAIFSTRIFLHTGKRGAVDMALHRLVKSGELIRLTPGLFVKKGSKWPSSLAVARAKAKAFGKTIMTNSAALAADFLQNVARPDTTVFDTVGGASRFYSGECLIELRRTACRKAILDSSAFGQMVRAVWKNGKNNFDWNTQSKLYEVFEGQKVRPNLKEHSPWMPAWITDFLI